MLFWACYFTRSTDLCQTRVLPGGELNECILDRLTDLQEERFIFTQCVIPIMDIVPQGELDDLMNDTRRGSGDHFLKQIGHHL